MAVLLVDSFDHYVTADMTKKWTTHTIGSVDTVVIASGEGRSSTDCLRVTGSAGAGGAFYAGGLGVTVAPADATFIVGFRLKVTNITEAGSSGDLLTETAGGFNASCLFAIRNASSTIFFVRLNNNGTLTAVRTGTALGTTTLTLSEATWHYIEVKVRIASGATGTVDIRIDEQTALALTSVITSSGSAWDEFRTGLLHSESLASDLIFRYDDFYLLDGSGDTSNDFLGDLRVDVLRPNAAGDTTSWTPSTGAVNYVLVDDTTANGDTDYVSTNTLDAIDVYNYPDAPVVGAPIKAVQLCMYVKKEDAGAATLAGVTRISGVNYVGSDLAPTTSYLIKRQIWDVKPSDSDEWGYTDLNAAQFGTKKTL